MRICLQILLIALFAECSSIQTEKQLVIEPDSILDSSIATHNNIVDSLTLIKSSIDSTRNSKPISYRPALDSGFNSLIIHHTEEKSIEESLTSIDFFIDSTNIGNRGNNKLEARLLKKKQSIFIQLSFYTLKQGKWIRKNQFEFEKDGISGIDPIISDFNNDSFKDFHYKALMAARGVNNVRRLFIYNPSDDCLILMKNSLDYPNIRYNERLDCIDAWMMHGCSSQAFLKIEKDSLKDFAWVQLSNGINIYEVDKSGNKRYILSDTTNRYGCYTRFISYKPLIEYNKLP